MVNAKPTINKTVNAYRDKGESVAASTICKWLFLFFSFRRVEYRGDF